MERPVPAFYCCYLLRSTVRHSSLYVGSTPDPVRRLRQHNGLSKGGAVRTSRDTLRPWEMVTIVSGFPSKVSALQFEWAWQNTHLTRHIPVSERITQHRTEVRISPRSGRSRRRPQRPRVSITDKLANLHVLLRVRSFERMPLRVRFYAEDVFRVWQRWDDRVNGKVRPGIDVRYEEIEGAAAGLLRTGGDRQVPGLGALVPSGIAALEVDYKNVKSHLDKSLPLVEAGSAIPCSVCHRNTSVASTPAVVCPHPDCAGVAHLSCLGTEFLRQEGNADDIVPLSGTCPTCKNRLEWSTLVTELSLRMRGEKDVKKLFKKPRKRSAPGDDAEGVATSGTAVEAVAAEDEDDDHDATASDKSEDEIPEFIIPRSLADSGWHADPGTTVGNDVDFRQYEPYLDIDDVIPTSYRAGADRVEIVIEDSDSDQAEILD